MKAKTKRVAVRVTFEGTVEVLVPLSVSPGRQKALAKAIALSRILATTENPDAPEAEAFDEYKEEFKLTLSKASREWDGCQVEGVGGGWEA